VVQFSVIVCAYNAVSRLQKTLEHLAAIDYPSDLVEIIIVDNNSSDGTAEFAEKSWRKAKSPFSFKMVQENRQGLSNARKRGIYEAKYDYIVFCDDDNWLSPQYLNIANSVITQNKFIGVLGGQGIPVTGETTLPNWFYTYASGYAVGVQRMKSGDISERGFVWGAGMVVRRNLLLNIFSAGHELLLSGRKGSKITAGDDCEMCKWFLLAGYKLWYEESMIFYHFIPKERLTDEYLDNLFKGFSDSCQILARYDQYLQRRVFRQSWYKKPVCWFKSEIGVLLDLSPYKSKVAELARNIVRLSAR
jgi:glycosyltransferase involved in cell wall biosynthesis